MATAKIWVSNELFGEAIRFTIILPYFELFIIYSYQKWFRTVVILLFVWYVFYFFHLLDWPQTNWNAHSMPRTFLKDENAYRKTWNTFFPIFSTSDNWFLLRLFRNYVFVSRTFLVFVLFSTKNSYLAILRPKYMKELGVRWIFLFHTSFD